MKVAYYIKKEELNSDERVLDTLSALRSGGAEVCRVCAPGDLARGTDILLCFGGDGTFLSGAVIALEADVPILGVNLGRLGFLSEGQPDDLVGKILSGSYEVQPRRVLEFSVADESVVVPYPYALNEVCLHRSGSDAIGINAEVDGKKLPTYWSDGLLVATASGSTAYNLSVGGPICTPDADVLVLSPVAPHNLGVRPLVIPGGAVVKISLSSRAASASLSFDNRMIPLEKGVEVVVRSCPKPLKRVSLGQSNFIEALKTRLFWGQDVRNSR